VSEGLSVELNQAIDGIWSEAPGDIGWEDWASLIEFNLRELLAACELALPYLHKMQADGVKTAIPVSNAIGVLEGVIGMATKGGE